LHSFEAAFVQSGVDIDSTLASPPTDCQLGPDAPPCRFRLQIVLDDGLLARTGGLLDDLTLGYNCSHATRSRRRSMAEAPEISCTKSYVNSQTTKISAKCCDEPDEDCSGGKIHTCNAGCSAAILPVWDACKTELGAAAAMLEGVIDLCRASSRSSSSGGGVDQVQHIDADGVSQTVASSRGGKWRVLAEEANCTKDYVFQKTAAINDECTRQGSNACCAHVECARAFAKLARQT
jgi:hypothetical protein